MSKVMAFKLVTGEEVVAEVTSSLEKEQLLLESGATDTTAVIEYKLRKPHTLQFQPIGPGQLGLAFVPWTLAHPSILEVTVPASAVLTTYQPSSAVERQYLEQTSGISLSANM